MTRKEKEFYPTRVVAWETDWGISIKVNMTPEFVEELLDLYFDGDEYVVNNNDDRYLNLNISLNESDYAGQGNNPDYIGSAKIPQPPKQGNRKKKRGSKKKTRGRNSHSSGEINYDDIPF